MEIVEVDVADLVEYEGNAKLHPHEQVDQIAASIEEFGNCDPIGVWHDPDGNMVVVEGHGRIMALKKLGIEKCPVVFLDHLNDEERRAYALVHNKLTMATWFDVGILNEELGSIELVDMGSFGLAPDDAEPSEYGNTSREISLDEYGDETFECKCEKCGFRFNA